MRPLRLASVRRFARLATRLYDDEMRPGGMEVGQFGLLAAIRRVPGISQAHIARGLGMDTTSLTRTLDVLLRHGWVEKAQDRIGAAACSRSPARAKRSFCGPGPTGSAPSGGLRPSSVPMGSKGSLTLSKRQPSRSTPRSPISLERAGLRDEETRRTRALAP